MRGVVWCKGDVDARALRDDRVVARRTNLVHVSVLVFTIAFSQAVHDGTDQDGGAGTNQSSNDTNDQLLAASILVDGDLVSGVNGRLFKIFSLLGSSHFSNLMFCVLLCGTKWESGKKKSPRVATWR